MITPDELARFFHESYEKLAPRFGYETRKESAKPWEEVPEQNKKLMLAVAEAVLREFIEPIGIESKQHEQRAKTLERRLVAVAQAIDPRFDTLRMEGA